MLVNLYIHLNEDAKIVNLLRIRIGTSFVNPQTTKLKLAKEFLWFVKKQGSKLVFRSKSCKVIKEKLIVMMIRISVTNFEIRFQQNEYLHCNLRTGIRQVRHGNTSSDFYDHKFLQLTIVSNMLLRTSSERIPSSNVMGTIGRLREISPFSHCNCT